MIFFPHYIIFSLSLISHRPTQPHLALHLNQFIMDNTKIIQWNCRSLINKKSEVIHLLNKYDPFVFALAETWLKPSNIFKLNGYLTIREDRSDGYGGVAILIKNSIPFSNIRLPPHSEEISIVAIKLQHICLVSIYVPHPSTPVLQEIKDLFSFLPKPFLILGDLNCHHQSWGCSTSTCYGDELLDIIDLHNLCILNTGAATRRCGPNQNQSAIDLSICSPSLASSLTWDILTSTYGSDHFPIVISYPFSNAKAPIRRSNLKHKLPDRNNNDWDKFRNIVDSKLCSLPVISDGNENSCAEALAHILIAAANDVFPVKNNNRSTIPSPPWWDSECTDLIKKRREAELSYNLDMSDINFVTLTNLNKEISKVFKKKKFESWRNFCSAISPNTHPTIVWRNIRRFRSIYHNSSPIPDSLASEFLDKLAPPWVPEAINLNLSPLTNNQVTSDTHTTLDLPFSLTELKGVIHRTKDSAPGIDGIPYSFFANLNDNVLNYYLDLINSIMKTGNIPVEWKHQMVLPFLKPNKTPSDASSYRPIVLSSILMKLAEHLIKNRLEWYVESKGLLAESQYGFRKGKSTTDCLSIFSSDIRLSFSNNQSTIAVFLDINAAYDNVVLSVLQNKLKALEVPLNLTNFIINILTERSVNMLIGDHDVSHLVWRGLPQGSVLSPLLYNIYTFDLDSSLTNHVKVLQYADDLLLYFSSQSIEQASDVINSALSTLESWLDLNGLDLSASKSAAVLFTRKRNIPLVNLFYKGTLIPVEDKFKYLGVIFDSKLSCVPHCDYIVNKCENHLNMLRCLSGVWWGAHPFSLKLIYNAIIRSTLDYGLFVLEPGSVMAFKKLDLIQSKALRIISGAMKSSPINALQIECGEAPLSLRRQFLSDKYLFRILQFSNHPLIPKLESLMLQIESSVYWSHKRAPCLVESYKKFLSLSSPIHRSNKLPLFNNSYESLLFNPNIEFNCVSKSDPDCHLSFNIFLIEHSDFHHIFTDAAKRSPTGCVGIGTYHTQYNIVQKIKLPPETSVFTGECFGILKALEYARVFKLKKCLIFTDSQSALLAIGKSPFRHKVQSPIIYAIRELAFRTISEGNTLQFAWIPGHSGIHGNVVADALAGDAVQCGDLVPYTNFGYDLETLPRNFLRDTWKVAWDISSKSKGRYFSFIQPEIPEKPWFGRAKFGKVETSILIRLRLGHVCSPVHLAKLHIIDDPNCSCGTDLGDLNHIFFSCPLLDRSSFLCNLLSLRIPFPTSILSLLCTNSFLVYKCIASFIILNNIKL
ncbi:hypothetical protein PYW07_003914 [Mythimna separata]|uniref:RNA-directed DNA polymerase from mobile element jockey n=1 Tax=Mythimna separata TaxID=271217 RepID=A0AAD7YQ20_MYTSE|nr:hypothetical protein PYW07_003914 [Mythimna separata]